MRTTSRTPAPRDFVGGACSFRISFTRTSSLRAQLRRSKPPIRQHHTRNQLHPWRNHRAKTVAQLRSPNDVDVFVLRRHAAGVNLRRAAFHLDQTGIIVDAQGNQLQPAITIPSSATNITIGSDGTVSVQIPGQQQAQQVGSIQLATFANPGGLSSVGNNYFLETTASGNPIVGTPGGTEGLGTIQQGALENSNVDVVGEFIQMILAQRSYEASSRVVRAADQMFQTINGLSS